MSGKEQEDSESMAGLRQKAEELAGRKERRNRIMSLDDAEALLHELEVHQIELELQNEELRRAQHELQASRDRYADLFEFAPVGYFMLDRHFRIVEANISASRILDMERRDLFSKRLSKFVMPEHQDVFYRWMKADAPPGGEDICELVMHRRNGTPFVAELKKAKDSGSDGGARYRVAVTDIAERKRMEEEVKHSRDELELRVHERTKRLHERSEQLRRMTGQLALAEQRERQRLSQVLHDGLQQILVGAKYRLAFIDRDADVHKAKYEVSELIDTAIETSRSLSAELSPPVLLQGDFVSSLEWLARWMHDKHGLDVNLVSHRKIKRLTTEATLLLFQAARELLFNVVKHSGVKTVRIEVEQSEDQIVLSIEDEGLGFDVRQLHSEKGRSGTGLPGVQERISYIGGRLEIESAPGRGSRFELIAPFSTLAGESESAIREEMQARISVLISPELGSSQDGTERRIRIMLVDDHMVMRQGLAGLLRGEPDFEIVGEASDGESAVKLARDIRPDVVLMDINMPRMDGIQATQIIHGELRDTCIIGLSMFQEPEREAAIREAGAVGYLSKTGPSDDVISTIRTCVSAA